MNIHNLTRRILVSLAFTLALIGTSWSEKIKADDAVNTGANAGDLRRALPTISDPQKTNPPLLKKPRPDKRSAPPDDLAFRVRVDEVNFKGNTLFDDTELRSHLRDWLNRDLALSEMKQMAETVANVYRSKDYLVHTYVPPQSMDTQTLLITVVEGKLGEISVELDQPVRMDPRKALSWITETTPKGTLINSTVVDRNLLLLDDLSGIKASAKLRRSSQAGHSDIVLNLQPQNSITGLLQTSNSGSHSTGEERITASVVFNSPLHRGDRLSADATLSEHSQFIRAAYRSPLGMRGWKLALEASTLQYSLQKDLAALSGEGDTTDFSVELVWAKARSRTHNVNLGFSLGQSRFDNRALGQSTSAYQIRDWGLSVDGNSMGRNRWSQFQLRLSSGKLDLGSLDTSENTELPTSFNTLGYQFSSGWQLDQQYIAKFKIRGQYSRKALDSAEQFSLGGPNGVRAYPVNEGSGESARVMSLEISRLLNKQWQVGGFIDHGQVQRRAAGDAVSAEHYSLSGLGLSTQWSSPSGWNLSAHLARRIGDNPNSGASGHDKDGTLRKNRLWLSLHREF